MTQKPMTEAGTLGGALDQTGNVRDHEAAIDVGPYHPELWMQRRKGIVCHLGARGGNGTDQGGLTGVWQAEEPDIGKDFQFQLEPPPRAGPAPSELTRRAIHARLEVKVAETAGAARHEQRALALARKIGDQLPGFFVGHHGAYRHAQHHVRRPFAVAIGAAPLLPVPCAVYARVAVVDERIDVLVGNRVDAAAAATVTAVGTAARHVFLAPEARATVATLAGVDFDDRFVDKF